MSRTFKEQMTLVIHVLEERQVQRVAWFNDAPFSVPDIIRQSQGDMAVALIHQEEGDVRDT